MIVFAFVLGGLLGAGLMRGHMLRDEIRFLREWLRKDAEKASR